MELDAGRREKEEELHGEWPVLGWGRVTESLGDSYAYSVTEWHHMKL